MFHKNGPRSDGQIPACCSDILSESQVFQCIKSLLVTGGRLPTMAQVFSGDAGSVFLVPQHAVRGFPPPCCLRTLRRVGFLHTLFLCVVRCQRLDFTRSVYVGINPDNIQQDSSPGKLSIMLPGHDSSQEQSISKLSQSRLFLTYWRPDGHSHLVLYSNSQVCIDN